MIYGAKSTSELAADLVLVNGNDTYVCNIDPAKRTSANTTADLELLPIWSIELHRTITLKNGAVMQRTLYPDGLLDFKFIPEKADEYNYQYHL